MTWLSTTRIVLYYIFLPLTTLFDLLLVLLAPLTHLSTYIAHGLLLPLSFLRKFESLYIYFGVAALIGLVTGSVLHFSSSMLTTFFNLRTTPENGAKGRNIASVSSKREKRELESIWKSSGGGLGNGQGNDPTPDALKKEYAEFLEKDRGKRKEGQGLLTQTILEEDDDSELEF